MNRSSEKHPSHETTRRSVLASGGLLTVSILAGCIGSGDDENGSDRDIVMPGEAGPRDESADESDLDHDETIPEELHEFLERTNAYDGSMADRTGEESVLVSVGSGEGGLAFLPAVLRIDSGTTIEWAWTGAGGAHNVVHDADEPVFHSGETVDATDEEYEHTFEQTGAYPYVCEPHWAAGMRGVVLVD